MESVHRPGKLIDPSQAYFWTPEWQAKEKEVEREKRKGRVKLFRSADELIKDLRNRSLCRLSKD